MNRLTAAVLFSVPALTGCYKSWVELNPAMSDQTQPTLLVSSSIVIEQNTTEDRGLAETVINVIDNAELEQVGPLIVDQLEDWLDARGFDLIVDTARAKGAQDIDLGDFANDFTVLTGAWFDPRAATFPVDNRTLNRRSYTRRIGERLDDPAVTDAYLYVTVTVNERMRALIMKQPALDLSVLVVDEQGEDLLRARGWGFGGTDPFIVRNDVDNLTTALEQAFDNLEIAPVEPTRAPQD